MKVHDQREKLKSSQAPAPGILWQGKLHRPWLIALMLAVTTLVVFWPVAFHDFVNYDDPDYVTANRHVQSGLTWTNLLWAMTAGHASNWHPLTWMSHMLDWQLFGQQAGGHHLVNLGLHLANAVILFFLLRRLTGAHWRSTIIAGFFAWHPLHVESVAWVSERKDVLSTLFFLLTIGAYAQWRALREQKAPHSSWGGVGETGSRRNGEGEGNPKSELRNPKQSRIDWKGQKGLNGPSPQPSPHRMRRGGNIKRTPSALYYFLALALFALGLMSKPMLVTLPFVLLLLDYWPLGRIDAAQLRFKRLWGLVLEKVPFFALSLASSIVTFLVQRRGGAVSSVLTVGQRVENALVSYVRYIGKMLWPDNLAVLYPHPGQWPASAVVAAMVLLLAISAIIGWQARRRPYAVVGWLWFLGTLIPVIGLVQVGVQAMADRYSYVPMIGLLILVAWGMADWVPAKPWKLKAVTLGAIFSLGACAILTVRQVHYWRNSEALFQHAVQVTSGNYLAYNNLGFYLANRGQVAEAMDNYRKSLAINPNYEDALNNMGYALAGQKQPAQAVPYYERALRVRPEHVEVHNNLGNALSDLGRLEEAIQHYQFVLQRKPDHADAHNNFGIALAMRGQLEEAINHFQAAIRYKANYASAHSNLGNAFAVQRKFEEAIKEFQESLRLNPRDAQALNNLANVLTELSRNEEAIGHYRQALELNPNNPEAHYNLGLTLARQGKRQEAVAHYTEALKLKPGYPEALAQLNAQPPAGR